MGEKVSIKESVNNILTELPEWLVDVEYENTFKQAKSLYEQVPKNTIPKIKGVPLDEAITYLAATFRDRFIAHILIPIYLFSDRHAECLRWLKGQLKGVPTQQAVLMKRMMLKVLYKKGRDYFNEEVLNYIIDDLQVFSPNKSFVEPLTIHTSWLLFFQTPIPEKQEEFSVLEAGSMYNELNNLYSELSIKCISPNDALLQLQSNYSYLKVRYHVLPEELYYHMPVFDSIVDNKDTNGGSESLVEFVETDSEESGKRSSNPEHTLARKALAMHYIFELLKVKQIDATVKGEFLQFLTGNHERNCYDAIRAPFYTKRNKFRKKDMKYVRRLLEGLGLHEAVKMLDEDLFRLSD